MSTITENILITASLPHDLVIYILNYDDRFITRNGKIMSRLSGIDERYDIIDWVFKERTQPYLYHLSDKYSTVIELMITRNKWYTIEATSCLIEQADTEETEETYRNICFHRSGCDTQLLLEY